MLKELVKEYGIENDVERANAVFGCACDVCKFKNECKACGCPCDNFEIDVDAVISLYGDEDGESKIYEYVNYTEEIIEVVEIIRDEIIDADEITTLQNVKERLTDVYERLYAGEISAMDAMIEIESDPTVKRFFLIEVVEIIRDELRNSDLTDFVDGYGRFGWKENAEELIKRVIDGIRFRIDHFIRTSLVKESGGLMLP